MAIFKKRGEREAGLEEAPELPELPQLPELPSMENSQATKLPSFPDSETNKEAGNGIIRSSVFEKPEFEAGLKESFPPVGPSIHARVPKTREISSESEAPSSMEISEWKPPRTIEIESNFDSEVHRSKPMSEIGTGVFKGETVEKTRKTGPVFIRIDKFENAISSFHDIKKRVSEIEALLKAVREVREKEEKELSDWESELQEMKSKVDSIDKNLFSGLD